MNILGIRELTIDILINDNNIENAIYGGGGTSHNIIWNLAQNNQNYNLYVGGITGNDYFSKKEISILEKYNINTEFLEKKNKNTRKVFTFIEKNRETKNVTVCPICNKDVWSSSSTYKINYNLLKEKNINVVIFDSYKKENNEIANYCIKNKILTILDFGVIGNLRYLSLEKLEELKDNPYNIIQMNNKVFKFLLSRFNLKTSQELFEILNVKLLVITNSNNGTVIIDKNNERNLIFNVDEVCDNNGAGDAFLASVIESYLSTNSFDDFYKLLEKLSLINITNVLKNKGARINYPYFYKEKLNEFDNYCKLCNKEILKNKSNKKSKFKIATSLDQLIERVNNGINSYNIKQIINLLSSLDNSKILILGSGASYISACYISKILNYYVYDKKIFVDVMYINEALNNKNILKYDKIIIISSSGTSSDVVKIINYLKNINVNAIYLITAKEKDIYLDIKNLEVISYYSDNWTRERGFLSIEGIVLPVILFVLSINKTINKVDLLLKIKEILDNYLQTDININYGSLIDIFYDNDSYIHALDLESKLIESGMGRVSLHEKKNFSHGRFSILKTMPSDLIIYLNFNSNNKYETKLINYLSSKNLNIIKLLEGKENNDGLDLFTNLIKIQKFILDISKIINFDLSDPGYDNKDKTLYKYK